MMLIDEPLSDGGRSLICGCLHQCHAVPSPRCECVCVPRAARVRMPHRWCISAQAVCMCVDLSVCVCHVSVADGTVSFGAAQLKRRPQSLAPLSHRGSL